MKQWIKENWSFVLLVVGVLAMAHIALKMDEKALCSSEATAYPECPQL